MTLKRIQVKLGSLWAADWIKDHVADIPSPGRDLLEYCQEVKTHHKEKRERLKAKKPRVEPTVAKEEKDKKEQKKDQGSW